MLRKFQNYWNATDTTTDIYSLWSSVITDHKVRHRIVSLIWNLEKFHFSDTLLKDNLDILLISIKMFEKN